MLAKIFCKWGRKVEGAGSTLWACDKHSVSPASGPRTCASQPPPPHLGWDRTGRLGGWVGYFPPPGQLASGKTWQVRLWLNVSPEGIVLVKKDRGSVFPSSCQKQRGIFSDMSEESGCVPGGETHKIGPPPHDPHRASTDVSAAGQVFLPGLQFLWTFQLWTCAQSGATLHIRLSVSSFGGSDLPIPSPLWQLSAGIEFIFLLGEVQEQHPSPFCARSEPKDCLSISFPLPTVGGGGTKGELRV